MFVCICGWILCERYSGCVWLTGGSIVLSSLNTQGRGGVCLSLPTACSPVCPPAYRCARLSALLPVPSVCLSVSRPICLFSSAFWELWVQVWACVCVCSFVCGASCGLCSVYGTGNKWKMAHGISMPCFIFSLSCCDRSDNERSSLPCLLLESSVLASGSWTPNGEARRRTCPSRNTQTDNHTHAHTKRKADAGVF